MYFGLGLEFTLNFSFALFSFFLIVLTVFFIQKRKILNVIQNASKEELESLVDFPFKNSAYEQTDSTKSAKDSTEKSHNQNEETEEMDKKQRFWHSFNAQNAKTGAKMFFVPLRLMMYGILVIGILILMQRELFDVFAFFLGLVSANVLLILWLTIPSKS